MGRVDIFVVRRTKKQQGIQQHFTECLVVESWGIVEIGEVEVITKLLFTWRQEKYCQHSTRAVKENERRTDGTIGYLC